MIFAKAFTMLLSALAPTAILIVLSAVLSLRQKTRGAISATVLVTGLALLVLIALVIEGHRIDALSGVIDSEVFLLALPLVSFTTVLGVLAHREKLSVLRIAACGIVGVTGLWWLGGFVAILSACSISPNGGF